MMDKVIVGIDVSKDKLDFCLLPAGDLFDVARTAAGLSELIDRLKAALERELFDVDSNIDKQIRLSPLWRDKETLLSSVPVSVPSPPAP